jgi:membrane protease YdiL (CAAX protease family)
MKFKNFEAPIFLVYRAFVLVLMEYFFIPPKTQMLLTGVTTLWTPPSLPAGLIWSASCLIGFLILPTLMTKFLFGNPLGEMGYSVAGFISHLKTYLLLFAGMAPLIYIASTRPDFARLYPFVPEAGRSLSSFLTWEIAYVLQFFALESFFRGSLLFTLNKHMEKWTAITVMVVPYTMIHFHKPVLETLGAILAGLALGWLSLRYKSWLGGAVLHSLVAVTMDSLSVSKTGLF